MANTYKALSTVTVGAGGASTISFSNIPQTYTDLCLVLSGRGSASNSDEARITFNDIATSYSSIVLYGTGSAAGSLTGSTSYVATQNNLSTETANTFSSVSFYIPNYALSNKKLLGIEAVRENNATAAYQNITAGLWSNTSAITKIQIALNNGNFVQYSTATLYGVFNADVSSAPATPTIGTATKTGTTTATVAYTGVSNAASYTATSTPGSLTATGTTSPLTVTGLTPATSYTFKVKSNNPFGSSAESAASNSITTDSTAFESISTITVSSGVASVEFTSIPATYQHLQIRAITRETNATFPGFSYLQVNNDTGSNYAVHLITANGSSAGTASATSQNIMYTGPVGSTTANTFGSMIIDILDYGSTSKYKTFRYWTCATNNSVGEMRYGSGLWYNLNGVTSIKLFGNNGNWQQYSSFALYGIKGA